jgi:Domain of unknown function (DUF5673)
LSSSGFSCTLNSFPIPVFWGRSTIAWVNIIACTFNAVCISILLLRWFFQKREAGELLLCIGKTEESKILLYGLPLGMLPLLALMVWKLVERISRGFPQGSSLAEDATRVIFFFSFVVYFIFLGLGKLEFRENGICYMRRFYTWHSIESYNWNQLKSGTLRIRLKSRFPLFAGFLNMNMNLTIPFKHRDAVDHILKERVPDKYL